MPDRWTNSWSLSAYCEEKDDPVGTIPFRRTDIERDEGNAFEISFPPVTETVTITHLALKDSSGAVRMIVPLNLLAWGKL